MEILILIKKGVFTQQRLFMVNNVLSPNASFSGRSFPLC